MCGIFGRFARTGSLGPIEPLLGATNLLRHRGPDQGGYWTDGPFFLGHRRLSIIDLSRGEQPMASADGRFVVTFNGEIYNFVELRAELEASGAHFGTGSDTEVLLHGYRRWGTALPARLLGMFAFAIVDRVESSLFIARDRFGEKPLLVHETDAQVNFASELSALASLSEVDHEWDVEALSLYLCLNYAPGDTTLLRSIRRLRPGFWRLYRRASVQEERYYHAPAALASAPKTLDDAAVELGERLDRAVRIALRSDVPLALFLSGGIDSSAVAESAVRQGVLKHAYCLHFSEAGFTELENARRVAENLGLELRVVELDVDRLPDFADLVSHGDDPLADSSALPVWTLARAAAADYKVVISGDGGDEVFGGYLTYKATALHRSLVTPLPPAFRRLLAKGATRLPVRDGKVPLTYKLMRFLRAADLPARDAHFTYNGTWLPAEVVHFLTPERRTAEPELGKRHGLPATPDLRELQIADCEDYLPNDILTKVDRMTMAHGLEARAPLLLPEVADYGIALPDRFKVSDFGSPKRVLRRLVRRRQSKETANARKQGFSIPVHRWLRGPLRPLCEELLSERRIDALGVLSSRAVTAAKRSHMEGKAQLGFELWGLMVLSEWYRVRVETPPRGSPEGLVERRFPSPE
ncbi:MAG TPA: asparagine synthase (glutamine-hydrolyzing) [Polyangiaceae bacterium]|jgi:asparagine synthase (glutamine-hydrolysing)